MNKAILPKANNWNDYWKLDQSKKFTKISWSKKRIINILEQYVDASKTALDAGCGSGFFSNYFCRRDLDTVSLDYSKEALDIARLATGGKAKTLKLDLLNESLSSQLNQNFDIIFSDGLMEHFVPKDQDKILKNLISVLSDEGVLVTFVPNKWSPWELIRPFYMPGIKEDPFVIKELTDLNERNDLDVIQCGGINTFPFSFSPDKTFGRQFGMLLYSISKKRTNN